MIATRAASGREASGTDLVLLRPLLGELNDLKRIRAAGVTASQAARGFARSWRMLLQGDELDSVALRVTAQAVAAARLGTVDPGVLRRVGLDHREATNVLLRSFDLVAGAIDPGLASSLRGALDEPDRGELDIELPGFVAALADQPRAGATRPGRPRLVLEPAESHAEHCYITAVYAVLVGGHEVTGAGLPFLAGLSHHLHNAVLPDSGFAGEELLGEHLGPIMARLNSEAIADLPDALADLVRQAQALARHSGSPESRAFHAADVLDRVLQMEHYARSTTFTLDQALGEMDLVHAGPLQSFHQDVLRRSGLL